MIVYITSLFSYFIGTYYTYVYCFLNLFENLLNINGQVAILNNLANFLSALEIEIDSNIVIQVINYLENEKNLSKL